MEHYLHGEISSFIPIRILYVDSSFGCLGLSDIGNRNNPVLVSDLKGFKVYYKKIIN